MKEETNIRQKNTADNVGRFDAEVKPTPIRVLLYGGGTQSTALLLMSLEGIFAPVDYAVMAEIGESEPAFVRDYVGKVKEFVKDRYNFDLTVLNTGDLQKDIENANGKRVASLPYYTKNGNDIGMTMRQCTYEYKIMPINRWIRQIADVKRGAKNVVERIFGISFDEMQRMKVSTDPFAFNSYPLVEARIRRADSIDYINDNFPELKNPPRSSCVFCPFHSDTYWKELKQKYPTEFERAVVFDSKIRNNPKFYSELYLHKSRVPLSQVDFESQQYLFEGCDEGYCGI